MTRRAAAAIALLVGCGGSRSDATEEVVLHVSAASGLSEFMPGLEASGSSAAAMDLVFAVPDSYVESMRPNGDAVILTLRSTAELRSEALASTLRGKELVSAKALDDNRIEAKFADAATAQLVAQYGALGFDLGPFAVESEEPNRIRLVRRGEGALDAIELIKSTKSDEWRRLLAHELDVVPWAASVYRSHFAGLESVRILDIPANDTAALYFNVRSARLANASVRRRIAAAINRKAIARLVCGNERCASVDVSGSTAVPIPERLAVLVAEDDSALRAAAKIMRHQLWPLGLELDIRPTSVPKIVESLTAGQYDLALIPLTLADHRFGFFLSPTHRKAFAMTGFANPEYDAAVDRGDLATAQLILDREVPVTRLFELRTFAAVDERFCGHVTPTSGSWLWLSKLYPCEEGPPP